MGCLIVSDELICPICGEATSSYMGHYRKDRLCKKHAVDFKKGILVRCDKCSEWYYTNEQCQCSKTLFTELPSDGFKECAACGTETTGYAFCRKCYRKYTKEEMLQILNKDFSSQSIDPPDNSEAISEYRTIDNNSENVSNNVVVIDFNNKAKCIICGKMTDGVLFCSSCYHRYKNKELLFRITNCTNVELLDEDYEGRYTCKDGHIVKSKSERDIDNYLFEHGISHAYERELPYGATDKEVLHPDFYLPNYMGEGKHVYIEHWGYNENNIQYTKTKKFKMPIYEKLGVTLICTYEKTDMGKIDTVLDRKLNKQFIKVSEINYEDTTADPNKKE